jgi:hypothetical protein
MAMGSIGFFDCHKSFGHAHETPCLCVIGRDTHVRRHRRMLLPWPVLRRWLPWHAWLWIHAVRRLCSDEPRQLGGKDDQQRTASQRGNGRLKSLAVTRPDVDTPRIIGTIALPRANRLHRLLESDNGHILTHKVCGRRTSSFVVILPQRIGPFSQQGPVD